MSHGIQRSTANADFDSIGNRPQLTERADMNHPEEDRRRSWSRSRYSALIDHVARGTSSVGVICWQAVDMTSGVCGHEHSGLIGQYWSTRKLVERMGFASLSSSQNMDTGRGHLLQMRPCGRWPSNPGVGRELQWERRSRSELPVPPAPATRQVGLCCKLRGKPFPAPGLT